MPRFFEHLVLVSYVLVGGMLDVKKRQEQYEVRLLYTSPSLLKPWINAQSLSYAPNLDTLHLEVGKSFSIGQ
jgi:hypothetical protein